MEFAFSFILTDLYRLKYESEGFYKHEYSIVGKILDISYI